MLTLTAERSGSALRCPRQQRNPRRSAMLWRLLLFTVLSVRRPALLCRSGASRSADGASAETERERVEPVQQRRTAACLAGMAPWLEASTGRRAMEFSSPRGPVRGCGIAHDERAGSGSAWYRTAPSIYQAERRQGPLIHHLLSDSSTSGFYTTVARGFHRMVSHGGGASYGFCGRGGIKGKYNCYLPLLATSSPRIRPRLMPYTVRPINQQTQS